jgi:hypothetical protein
MICHCIIAKQASEKQMPIPFAFQAATLLRAGVMQLFNILYLFPNLFDKNF